jgi:simple sugar transport system substrate-binding protein
MRQGKDARREHQMRTRTRLLALALAAPLVFAACSGDDDSGQAQQTNAGQAANMTIAVVVHAGAGDAFWDVVKNGAEAAGKQYGITVNCNGNGDPAQQSQLIDAAVAQKVDGLVVSMANPDALKGRREGGAGGHSRHHHQLRSGPVQGVRRAHARRPVRGRRR